MNALVLGGLSVSSVGVGCNQFGPTCDAAQTADVVHAALDAGITFFDTADEYGPDGLSEEYLGRALARRRDEAVVATKFGHHFSGDPRRGGASARWIIEAVEGSLRRLGTDHIDLYQQHFPDPEAPVEETLSALDRLVRDGKVREVGVCNVDRAELDARVGLARREGIRTIVSAQNRYNLLRQDARHELLPTVRRHGLQLLPFFPLAAGMLSGRYRAGEQPPADSRFGRHLEPEHARHVIERDASRVHTLAAWAADHGHGVAELAVAWLASQNGVGPVIAGATTPAQVRANAAASEWVLSAAEVDEVAAVARSPVP